MTNIILCGGSGTRLWPLSRKLFPKQFVQLFEGESLFQKTVKRNSALCEKSIIVSNAEQYFLALDQLEENGVSLEDSTFLLEPIGKNTAPAIALACMALESEEIVLISPSDHLIKDENAYQAVLKKAMELSSAGNLVTFGIKPAFPETGFGYIESSGEDVRSFKEKPDLATAQGYLAKGNYYWNSGMFCFKAGVFLEELKAHSPAIFEACEFAHKNRIQINGNQYKIRLQDMEAIPEDSIDYAVMEKSCKVKVVPSDIGWSDVGSFDALSEVLPNDDDNNFVVANKEVALIDVKDLIVIDTEDALLISKKGSSQKVKEVVTRLNKRGSELPTVHMTVHRPWGVYTVLEDSQGYKIKKIVVKPGKRLSLQKHFHRNEHWIVLSGTASVQVGEEVRYVYPNESTYIKMGETHRLGNDGEIPVVLIEAQVGEYTGEDDIVRIEDDFKRI